MQGPGIGKVGSHTESGDGLFDLGKAGKVNVTRTFGD